MAGEYELEVLAVVPPPIEFMSTLHSSQQEISGRQVWCGSLLLAHMLVKVHRDDMSYFRSKRILELGSGTGLVGMLASKLGPPACVALTDGDDQAMALLAENVQNPFNCIDSSVAKSKFLWWSEEIAAFREWCQQSWPIEFADNVTFDIIVAGDVMYKTNLPKIFFETVDTLLSETGVLWLCHVPRSTVTHSVVVQAAKDCGFQVQSHMTETMDVADCPKGDIVRAVIYRVTR